MKLVVITLVACGLWGGGNVQAGASLYDLIQSGRLDEARDSLSQVATATARDGDLLFCQSLLEADGSEAVKEMEAALAASANIRFQEEIFYRLAQYYLLQKNYDRLDELIAGYNARWEQGRFHARMMRLSVLVDEARHQHDAALRQCDRYLVAYNSGADAQWGLVDKARIMRGNNKDIGSDAMLKQLSREKDGEGIPQALYLLGADAIRKRRPDDAIFYYNLMRESSPAAVGQDQMVTARGEMPEQNTDTRAEKITGTYYTVKVGVFSSPDNAKRQADSFKEYGKPVNIDARTISGVRYHVVYVGRFQDYRDALAFKTQLESTHGEVFQVVTR